ncbi:MAG: serine hydrolase domain-containing protein, partial [Gilvibacter sp.]
MKLPLFIFLAVGLLLSACTNPEKETDPSTVAKQEPNTIPTFSEPQDWSRAEKNGVITYTAPEGNATLSFVSVAEAKDAQTAAKLAWQMMDPGFARAVKLQTEEAVARGWDAILQIEYETSPAEERVVYAYPHSFKGQWSVFLIDANLGTLGKRSAAARKMYKSLTRAGYQSEDLTGRIAKHITPDMLNEFLAFVESSAKALDVPGVGVGIIQNGQVIFSGGVGVKDQRTGEAIDGDTRFIIASNTKGMTTLLLAKLVELGRIDWDDPVVSHYPDFRLGDDDTTKSVLIRHLVCACTGLPRKDYEWVFNNSPDTPAQTVFDELAATQPTSGFGELY